jgi:1-acyl-sn-glycerol-3-phosphate acyltransferase
LAILLTLIACPVQAVLLLLPGQGKVRFAEFYWMLIGRSLGLRVRRTGAKLAAAERPVLFVANHASWLDIVALGATLPAAFVAKGEIGRWPGVNIIARLGQTIFVSRRRGTLNGEADAMRARLDSGGNIILFPEGTSSDGTHVLPFRSTFFAIAEPAGGAARPLIQPVSVAYDEAGFLPADHACRALFAWYGDMSLADHAWRVLQLRGMAVTVHVHPAVEPEQYPGRKRLAPALWQIVAGGAAALRQHRRDSPALTG